MAYGQIVRVAVSQTQAPIPSNLQKMGAFVSYGGTNLPAGSTVLLTQFSDLTPYIAGQTAGTVNLTASGSTVTGTITNAGPGGLTAGQSYFMNVQAPGLVNYAYYGGVWLVTMTSPTTFTYTTNGAPTGPTAGTFQLYSNLELVQMATTFFASGTGQSVYVLELGTQSVNAGITAFTAYVAANQYAFYHYLLPRSWSFVAEESLLLPLLQLYNSTTSMVYFWVTGQAAGYTYPLTNILALTELNAKCMFLLVENFNIQPNEFSLASAFYTALNYAPSTTNMVTPLNYSYMYGVTPYSLTGSQSVFPIFKAAAVNYVGTGAEGGISNTILFGGYTGDGRAFNYWYSVDWVQLNLRLDLANEIINGSNNPQAPLYLNQMGINRLQARAQGTMTRGITYGLALAPVSVTAVPFSTYYVTNESDYRIGNYSGLGVTYTPAQGFDTILFNVDVTDFPIAAG